MGELFEQILNGEFDYPEEYWDDVSDQAKDFIDNLLLVDPALRLTAEQALEHPWLQGAATDKLLHVPEKMEQFTSGKLKK